MAGGGARRCSFRGPPQPLPTAATRLLALTGSWAGAAEDFPPPPPIKLWGAGAFMACSPVGACRQ